MNIEIINVGTELLLGEIVNTNATYIQKMCKELGFNVYYQTVVGDNDDRFLQCLETAFSRGANCVITTGGLGPTQDDVTKEISAKYLGLPLVLHQEELDKVIAKIDFISTSKIIPKNNHKQAYYPRDVYILENDIGTANGCIMQNENKTIINLPGPPKELRYVCDHSLLPYLKQYQKDVLFTEDIKTYGIGESRVDELLYNIINDQQDVSIALYAGEGIVRIRLGVKSKSKVDATSRMQLVKQQIQDILNEYIIDEKQIRQYVQDNIPTYCIEYLDDYRLPKEINLGDNQTDVNPSLRIQISCKTEVLGEIVTFTLCYKEHKETVTIAFLSEANLSIVKLEAKLVFSLYDFINKYNKN